MKNRIKKTINSIPKERLILSLFVIFALIFIFTYEYLGNNISFKEILQMLTIYGVIQVLIRQTGLESSHNSTNEKLNENRLTDKLHYDELFLKVSDLENKINSKINTIESRVDSNVKGISREFKELGRLEGKLDSIKKEIQYLQLKLDNNEK